MPQPTQTYANHTRLDPAFHFFLLPVSAITVGLATYHAVRHFSFTTFWLIVLSLAFVVAVLKLRMYALKVQDRVIRLEERLRLTQILNEPLRSRVGELREGQLIALRFAPDCECEALVARALSEGLTNAAIKQSITDWRADHFRV